MITYTLRTVPLERAGHALHLDRLPEGSELEVFPGGSHIMIYEEPLYRAFQDRVIRFLGKALR